MWAPTTTPKGGTVTYRDKRKLNGADLYGTYREGKQVSPEIIAGNMITRPLSSAGRS